MTTNRAILKLRTGASYEIQLDEELMDFLARFEWLKFLLADGGSLFTATSNIDHVVTKESGR